MTNAEKIQILKENIQICLNNSKNINETEIFNYAKQRAKEMQIEITKGEIRSIINEILLYYKEETQEFTDEDFLNIQNKSCPNFIKEFEKDNPFLAP